MLRGLAFYEVTLVYKCEACGLKSEPFPSSFHPRSTPFTVHLPDKWVVINELAYCGRHVIVIRNGIITVTELAITETTS